MTAQRQPCCLLRSICCFCSPRALTLLYSARSPSLSPPFFSSLPLRPLTHALPFFSSLTLFICPACQRHGGDTQSMQLHHFGCAPFFHALYPVSWLFWLNLPKTRGQSTILIFCKIKISQFDAFGIMCTLPNFDQLFSCL